MRVVSKVQPPILSVASGNQNTKQAPPKPDILSLILNNVMERTTSSMIATVSYTKRSCHGQERGWIQKLTKLDDTNKEAWGDTREYKENQMWHDNQ